MFGVVFTFYGSDRDDALENIVKERAQSIAGYATAWETAREVSYVDAHDSIGLGFYRVRTMLDEREPETTDVRYRRS